MAEPLHASVLIDSADLVESPEYVETSTDPIAAATGSVVRVEGGTPSSLTPGYTDLAEQVATVGPAAVEGELWRFIREARWRTVTPGLVVILADPNQPEVARQRAFGRIHAELERARQVTCDNPPKLPSTQRWEPTSP